MSVNFTTKNVVWLICCLCLFFLTLFITFRWHPVQKQTNSNIYLRKSEINIVMVQHDSCPWSYFWCLVEKGIDDAARDFNVNVELLRPLRTSNENNSDFNNKQITLIKEIVGKIEKQEDENPNRIDAFGITITIIDELDKSNINELDESIDKQEKSTDKQKKSADQQTESTEPEKQSQVINLLKQIHKKIPVIVYNSDSNQTKNDSPYLMYIGQDDKQAGYEAGLRLADTIEKDKNGRAVCINHLPTATNLQLRCQGFKEAIDEVNEKRKKEGKEDIKYIKYKCLRTTRDPEKIKEDLIEDYTNNDKDRIKTIYLSLGPIGASPFYEFIDDKDTKLGKDNFAHGIFDLSERIIENIKNGNTLFAIDQQPYLQGYMTVQLLFWNVKYNFKLKSNTNNPLIISTGPSFVDDSNINTIDEIVGKYR